MKPLTVLIADDEPLARETVRDLLAAEPEVEVVAECGSGRETLAAIRRIRPDIVFLDVEMPEVSGLDLLHDLAPGERPIVVLVTAHGEHALDAFDLEALDYLLKPFSDRRFGEAVARAVRKARETALYAAAASVVAGGDGAADPMPSPDPERAARSMSQRLPVRRGQRVLLLDPSRVRWVESEDYYARLHTDAESFLIRESLASLERRLDPRRYRRVHRSAIVRRDVVREMRSVGSGGRILVLDDGTEVRVSRARVRGLESWLGLAPSGVDLSSGR